MNTPSSDKPMDDMLPVSTEPVSENWKKGIASAPIPPADIASETLKNFGIGSGPGGAGGHV